MMKKIFAFIKGMPEARTQILLVIGFIILPVISLCAIFYITVINDEQPKSSERLKIPQAVINNLNN